jgi:hypothetical protein
MENLSGHIATVIVGIVVGIILMLLQPKARILYWFPANFFFDLKDRNVRIQTNTLTIQNTGRKTAENIEIIHKTKPDFYQFYPPVVYQEEYNLTGEHILRLENLGPKEHTTLQLLSYLTPPVFLNVRCKDCLAELISIQPQRVVPKWQKALAGLMLFIGLGFSCYWLIRAVIFISKNIGVA